MGSRSPSTPPQSDGAARPPGPEQASAAARRPRRAALARPRHGACARCAAAHALCAALRCAAPSAPARSTRRAIAWRSCAAPGSRSTPTASAPTSLRGGSRPRPSAFAASSSRASVCAMRRRSRTGSVARPTRCDASWPPCWRSSREISHARRWLALDPLHEPAHRALIPIYATQGDRADALAQYRDCVRTLSRELGVPPLTETTTFRMQGTPQFGPPAKPGSERRCDLAGLSGDGADIDDTPASRHSERVADARRGVRKSSLAGAWAGRSVTLVYISEANVDLGQHASRPSGSDTTEIVPSPVDPAYQNRGSERAAWLRSGGNRHTVPAG